MFPACLDEYIEQDNPVRYIDAFVGSQDLEELGFNHTKREAPGNGGRPSYDPSDILKLLIYGYFNSIRSSQKVLYDSIGASQILKNVGRNVGEMFRFKTIHSDNITLGNHIIICASPHQYATIFEQINR